MSEVIAGRYELYEIIGSGGQGVVHRAFDRWTSSMVALKRLRHPTHGDNAGEMADLCHPHIAGILDIVQDPGGAYIALEYVEGPGVRDLFLTSGERAIRAVFADVCHGLHHAHGQGICHGDLKPGNILVEERTGGRFRGRVVDFGLGRTILASPGAFAGTVAYAAPEVLRGSGADHRADLYSLGVSLYETITGRTPFIGPDPRTIADGHLHQAPPDPRLENPEVSEELSRLLESLLAKEPSQRPSSAAAVAGRLASDREPLPLGEPAWIPRTRALAVLGELEDRAARGCGSVAIVSGELGIGKSRLLRRFGVDTGIKGRPRVFLQCGSPRGRPSLAEELLHRSGALAGSDGQHTVSSPGVAASEIACRLLELLKTAAGDGCTIVLLDDLDQADVEFLNLFHALWPLVASAPVLLVATAPSQRLRQLTSEAAGLLAVPHVHRIALRPFTAAETRLLFSSLLCWRDPDPTIHAAIHRASAGNPGLASEVTRLLVRGGHLVRRWDTWVVPEAVPLALLRDRPTGIAAAMIDALRAEERHVLGVVAMLGPGASEDMIAQVSCRDQHHLPSILSSLAAYGLVTGHAGQWSGRHGIVAEAAISNLSTEERIEAHARAAAYIRSRWPGAHQWIAPLARHLAGAGHQEEARRVALAGGDEALAERRHGAALSLYDLAIPPTSSWGDQVEARARWGRARCHVTLGKWPPAVSELTLVLDSPLSSFLTPDEHLSARISLSRSLAADGRQGEATGLVQEILDIVGPGHPRHSEVMATAALVAAEGKQWSSAATLARACLEEMPADADQALRAGVENTLGAALLMVGSPQESITHFTASLKRRTALGESIDAGRCALNLALAAWSMGSYEQARRHAVDAERRFLETGAVAWQAQTLSTHGLVELHAGEAAKALSLFEEAFRLATGAGRWRAAGLALNNLGMAQKAQGEWGKAAERFREAYRVGRRRGDRSMVDAAIINLGDLHASLGEYGDAEHWYAEGIARAEREGSGLTTGICNLGLAWVFREQGFLDQAEEHLGRARDKIEHAGDTRVLIHARCERAKLRLRQGRLLEALDALEQAGSETDMGVYERAMVLRIKGAAMGASGRTDEASRAFERCLELLEPTELVYGLALAHLELGRWLSSHGPVSPFRTAERYLTLARDSFRRMGAPRRVEEVEVELGRLSLVPGLPHPIGPDSRKLSILYRMLSLANAPGASVDALEGILDLAVHAVGAQRGLIILVDKDSGELAVRAQVDIDGATIADARRLSATVVRQVAGAGTPVFSPDALGDARFRSYESIKLHRIACFMCVPLVLRDEIIGTIYVDSCSLEHRFTQDEVDFLQAFANHAAIAMENIRHRDELERENVYLQKALKSTHAFGTIIGHSPPMQAVYRTMLAATRSAVTVMIQGPTGTGKELVARAIHYNGTRAGARFVAVNCGAFPETLLESELFGYVRGAFTGAFKTTPGLFQTADGGTIFLDEVADMSPGLQAKVLRVLETGEVKQLGHPGVGRVDTRVICATNRDLEAEVRAGRFRDDLYYRLRVVTIRLPSLRERSQDIPLLAAHFLKLYRERFASPVRGLSDDALAMLCRREWPGNVRELEHTIEAALALCQGRLITTNTLSLALGASVPEPSGECSGLPLAETRRAVERHCIAQALEATGWNVSATSRRLGVDRRQLQRLMRRYGFRPAREQA